METKIKSFTQLIVWQKGHSLALEIYTLTQKFPKCEIFGLVSQIRRCAVSITSNIAEGFSRRTEKEKIQFYHISLGSLTELQNQLLLARDLKYVNIEEFKNTANLSVEVAKLLNATISKLKSS